MVAGRGSFVSSSLRASDALVSYSPGSLVAPPRSHWLVAMALCGALLGLSASTCLADPPEGYAVRGTPTIDGKIEAAWSQVPAIRMKKVIPELTTLPLAQAARGHVRLLWDDEALHMLWEITDAKRSASSSDPWAQDSVEVFVDENYGRTTSYEPDDVQCRVNYRGESSGGGAFSYDDVKAIAVETTDGYLIEMSLFWRELTPKPGQKIGADFQINDDPGTGNREAVAKWSDPKDRSWNDTSGFGTIHLVASAKDIPAEILKKAAQESDDLMQSNGDASKPNVNSQSAKDDPRDVPDWVADAVFYQIFPERFRNGDSKNDPIRDSLEFVDVVPTSWRISPWTGDWYARDAWEKELGPNFYDDGVFHRRYGGDLQGVLDKLDYLADLGINAIYFNPVFYARSLHKYDATSMHHIDPYFGPDPEGDLKLIAQETSDPKTWHWTAADKLFLRLIQQAHARGIRIIIDGVFNHTGRDFFAFSNLRDKQQESPYRDWYVVQKYDDPNTAEREFRYQGWWGVETLPEFANNADGQDLHPGPKAYIMDITSRWMDPNGDGDPKDGIDGWRLDVSNEVPDAFWRDWHTHVRKINPQAYTVSEYWHDAADYLRRCHFSASMNYFSFAFPVKGFLVDDAIPAGDFVEQIEGRRMGIAAFRQPAMLNLVDSHDTDRIASMIVNRGRKFLKPERFDYDVTERVSPRHDPDYDVRKPNAEERALQKMVALFQLTYVGAPMVYYGTEAGAWGGDDPCDRMPMIWDDLEYAPQASHPIAGKSRPRDPVAFDRELHDFYRRAIRMRTSEPALRRGGLVFLAADDSEKTFCFHRTLEQDRLLVAFNRSDEPRRLAVVPSAVGVGGAKGLELICSTTDTAAGGPKATLGSSALTLSLPPRSAAVWKVRPRQ